MPVPHFNIKITQRSKGNSAVAGAAYQAGEKLFSEYDQKTKNYTCKKEVVYADAGGNGNNGDWRTGDAGIGNPCCKLVSENSVGGYHGNYVRQNDRNIPLHFACSDSVCNHE